MLIRKAVIPVAGLGTRMLPASSTVSKCMFPVVDKPVIHYVVEEAIESGIEEIVLIVGSNREAIQNYFSDSNPQYTNHLKEKCEFQFVVQETLNGLGSAVNCARDMIGNSRFAVLLGDAILRAKQPVIGQLMHQMTIDTGAVIGVEEVSDTAVSRYGIVAVDRLSNRLFSVTNLVEKPAPENAPSNLAIAARYIFDAAIFDALESTDADHRGEIQLTHAIQSLSNQKPVLALQFEGKRYDIGNKGDFLRTNIAIALEDPNTKDELINWMQVKLSEIA